jgi:ubiquitin carboxyl-terminal hydrolase 25/28
LKFLGAETDTTDDGIEALQTIKLADDPATAMQLREAIKVVAEHRNSEYLRNVLAGTAPPPSQMDIDKAYRLVGLDPTQSLDDEQVQHLLDQIRVNLNEEPHRSVAFREALDIIAARTQNQAIRAYVNELSPTSLALMTSDLEEPRGLNNIGNTCYLASLLQYLYTVATVREIVKKIDEIGETVQDDVDLVKQVDEMPVSKEQVRRALQCECGTNLYHYSS